MNRLPLLLPIRSIVFVLVFVIGALAAHKHVDEISNWWSIIAVVVNIMNILLLVYAARRNGKTYWELINYQKGKTRLGQVLLVSLMILTTTGALRKFKKRYISLEVGICIYFFAYVVAATIYMTSLTISPELMWKRGIIIALLCVGTLALEYISAKRLLKSCDDIIDRLQMKENDLK